MEPQPQMQPVNPPPQMEYGNPPPRPLDLKPAPRRPLDLKPAPRQPLDLRPRPQNLREYGQAVGESIERDLRNPFQVLEPVVNNPLNYAPGKGLVGIASTVAERATDPATFNPSKPFETIDVPSLPMPDEFQDIPVSETTRFNPDAIDQGPLETAGQPAIPGQPGSVPGVAYAVRWSVEWYPNYVREAENTYTGLTGAVTTTTGVDYFGSGQPSIAWTEFTGSNGVSIRVARTRWFGDGTVQARNGRGELFQPSGAPEPADQPEIAPTFSPNPARQPLAMPDFEIFPEPNDGFMPGFEPIGQPLFEPAPTGEIVPYEQPPIDDITDRLRPRYPNPLPTAPPDNQPWKYPNTPTAPDFPDFDPVTPTQRSRWRIRWPWATPRPGNTGEDMAPPAQQKEKPKTTPPLTRECCGDDIVRDEGRRLREALKDLADVLGNRAGCEVMTDIPTWVCDDTGNGYVEQKVSQTAANLSQAFNLLAEEVAAIRQKLGICDESTMQNADPSILAQDTATEGQTVWYVQLPALVRQVELIISGQIPTAFRLYDTTLSGEQQGKFGSITLSYPGSAGGNTADAFHQWAWTRRTSLYVDKPLRETRYIRVYVKSGLSWILYDTGLRN